LKQENKQHGEEGANHTHRLNVGYNNWKLYLQGRNENKGQV
jgi:hypothetical protein